MNNETNKQNQNDHKLETTFANQSKKRTAELFNELNDAKKRTKETRTNIDNRLAIIQNGICEWHQESNNYMKQLNKEKRVTEQFYETRNKYNEELDKHINDIQLLLEQLKNVE